MQPGETYAAYRWRQARIWAGNLAADPKTPFSRLKRAQIEAGLWEGRMKEPEA